MICKRENRIIKDSIKNREGRGEIEDKKRNKNNKWNTVINKVNISPTRAITLNVNGLNIPLERQRLSEWIKK